jgi:RNA polymerase sigma factor (sigma-70 family)
LAGIEFLFGVPFGGHYTLEPMDDLEDADLLRRYADDRSEAAFVEFVRRHLNLVYRSALRQVHGDAHRAQDVTQMVFTAAARQASSLSRHPRLLGWLFTTTRFVSSATLRAERRRRTRETEALAMQTILSDPSPENWNEVRPVIDDAMQELNGADREAVLLHFFEGRPFAEVGARLSLKEDAARMRVSRAVEKLRNALTCRGIASSAAALAVMLAAESAVAAPATLLAVAAAIPAGTAPATGGGLGILHFMNTSKLAIAMAAGLGLLAAGAGVYCTVAAGADFARGESELKSEGDELPLLRARLAQVAAEAAGAESQRASLSGVQSRLQATAKATPAKGPVLIRASYARDLQVLAKNPAFEAAYMRNVRFQLGSTFLGLYEQLGLNPQQIERFKAAILKSSQADFDVAASAATYGTPIDDPAIAGLYAKDRAQLAGDLAGIASVDQVDAYLRLQSRGAGVATQLGDALTYSAAPLTPPQEAALVRLASAHVDPSTGAVDWDALTEQATGFLSAPQLAMLSAVQARAQYRLATGNSP